jgi:tripeptide aminopeptidase
MKTDYLQYINRKRMIKTFTELVKIYSPSLKEGKIAGVSAKILKELGCSVSFDNAGKKIGGEVGNLIAKFKGNINSKPILLCAHMDMVEPCKNIKPIVKEYRICSDGTTISGADCRSGITVILEVLRILKEKKLPHPPIEIVFTIAEEGLMLGSRNLDYSKIKSKNAISIDTEFAGKVTTKCPIKEVIDITIKGVSSHAGIYPERGISAIEIAGDIIHLMKLGRIDTETTANLGIIEGGNATGVVTPQVKLKGEVRSFSNAKFTKQINHMKEVCRKMEKKWRKKVDGKLLKPCIDFKTDRLYSGFNLPLSAPTLKALFKSAKLQELSVTPIQRNAGADVAVFNSNGISACNLGCGQKNQHTTREYLDLKDFFISAQITLGAVLNFREHQIEDYQEKIFGVKEEINGEFSQT